MTFAPFGRTFPTLLIGALGAAIAWAIGFPAPFLTGPASAVTAASLAGFNLAIDRRFRDVVFMFLGVSIGQTVTPEVISAAARWPVSLICLGVMLLVIIVPSRAYGCRQPSTDAACVRQASTNSSTLSFRPSAQPCRSAL